LCLGELAQPLACRFGEKSGAVASHTVNSGDQAFVHGDIEPYGLSGQLDMREEVARNLDILIDRNFGMRPPESPRLPAPAVRCAQRAPARGSPSPRKGYLPKDTQPGTSEKKTPKR